MTTLLTTLASLALAAPVGATSPAAFDSCDALMDHAQRWRGERIAYAATPFIAELGVTPMVLADASIAVTAVNGVDELRSARVDGDRLWGVVDGRLLVSGLADNWALEVPLPGTVLGLLDAEDGVWALQQVTGEAARSLGVKNGGVAWSQVSEDADGPVVLSSDAVDGMLVDARVTEGRLVLVTRADLRLRSTVRALKAHEGVAACDAIWRDPSDLTSAPVLHTVWTIQGDERIATGWLGSVDHISVSDKHTWLVSEQPDASVITGVALSGGVVGSTVTPGAVLHRSGISEHNGKLRVAVQERNLSSAVVTFRVDGLAEVGRLTGLAPGETLTGATIVKDRAYLYTWRIDKGDPLFVIDLSAAAPTLLGELAIPGRSDAVAVLGRGRIVTVGQEVVDGRTHASVSLFDVSNPAAPVLADVVHLAGRSSEAQDDTAAWTWAPESGTLLLASGNGQRRQLHALRIDGDRFLPAGVWDGGDVRAVAWSEGAPVGLTASGSVRGVGTMWAPAARLGTARPNSAALTAVDEER